MRCFFISTKKPDVDATPSPPTLEVQWQWFPYFISVDPLLRKRLAQAWKEEWGGKITTAMSTKEELRMHQWILRWISLQYPAFEGLYEYLSSMGGVSQAL